MSISIKKLSLSLGLIVGLSGMLATAYGEVRLPHGEFLESTVDLKVKVLGGFVSMTRSWDKGQWHFNPAWNSLKFTYDSLDGSVKSIELLGAEYKKTTPGTFVLGTSSFIKVTATGYRWQDKTGNSVEYNAQGIIQAYSDRNDIKVSFQYDAAGKRTGVFDHHGNQVLWFEYTADRLSAIRDATNRRVTYGYTGNDLTTVVDVLNNTWRYAYTAGKLSALTDPENRTLTLTYDGGGRVASAKDRNNIGYTYEYDYDANKREYFVRQRTNSGKITETWYDAQSNVIRKDINGKIFLTANIDTATRTTTTIDARGLATTVTRDQWDNIIKTVYPDGATVSSAYEFKYSNPLISTDENGVITNYEYDTKGNLTRLTEAFGLPEQRVTEYSYDQYGQRKTENRKGNPSTNTADAITYFDYDLNGNLIEVIDAENYATRYPAEDYNVQGNSKRMIDARGKAWTKTYDNKGNVLTESDPLNHTNSTGYDRAGWRTSTTDAVGNINRYVYDDRQNVITVTDPYGAVTRYEYNTDNLITKVTDAENKVIQIVEYDLDGRVNRQTDGNGNVTSIIYGDEPSGLNNLILKIVYPTFSQEFKYDSRNRVVETIDVLDSTTKLSSKTAYDAKGYLLSTTDKTNKTTRYTFDALGRPKIITDAMSGTTEVAYDNRDNLIVLTDAKGHAHRFTYDRVNRKLTEVRPMGQTITYSYTATGELDTRTDPKGQVKKFTYNDAGRMILESYYRSATDLTNNNAVRSTTYSFNALGRPTGYSDTLPSSGLASIGITTYDQRGLRKTGESINYGNFTLSYSYDYYANGQKKSFTGPDGVTMHYTYDTNNQLATIQLPTGNFTVNSYKWTAPSQITLPGGSIRSQSYDALLRLTQIQVKDPGQSDVLTYQYGYDNVGNIKTKNTEHGNYSYTYDDLYQLTSASNPSPLPAEVYTYDPIGNRMTDTKTAGIWSYNDNNQLQGIDGLSFEYDANGNTTKKIDANNPNQTRTYIYDTRDRLIEVLDQNNNLMATYTYDPLGRRLSKETTGTSSIKTWFFYSDEGLVAEANSSGVVSRSYGYRPNSIWGTDPIYLKEGENIYYFQNDHLGTPQKLTAQSGMVIWSAKADAFGTATVDASSVITNNLRFPGQYFDSETGLHYNRHRYYDPSSSRYLTSDPIGLIADLNIYRYSRSNPVSYFDETGLSPSCKAYDLGTWEPAGQTTKNRKENDYFLRIKTTITPDGIGTSPQGPEPGRPIPFPICPSIDFMVKVYKVYKHVYEWDLYDKYKRTEKYECVTDHCPPMTCCSIEPTTDLIEVEKFREEFVKHVSGSDTKDIYWFGFKISIDLCMPMRR